MVSKHSLYKSERRWEKASSESKSVSSFQRKVNFLKKDLKAVSLSNKLKKMQLTNFSNLVDYLMKHNKTNKEDIKKFLTTKKQAIEELKSEEKTKGKNKWHPKEKEN